MHTTATSASDAAAHRGVEPRSVVAGHVAAALVDELHVDPQQGGRSPASGVTMSGNHGPGRCSLRRSDRAEAGGAVPGRGSPGTVGRLHAGSRGGPDSGSRLRGVAGRQPPDRSPRPGAAPAIERQRPVVVEQDQRLGRGSTGEGRPWAVPKRPWRGVVVDVRVVEQAEVELVTEHASHRQVDTDTGRSRRRPGRAASRSRRGPGARRRARRAVPSPPPPPWSGRPGGGFAAGRPRSSPRRPFRRTRARRAAVR